MQNTIVLATKNIHKVSELQAMLPECHVCAMSDIGVDLDIEETGTTFFENASTKAMALRKHLMNTNRQDYIVAAEDSGLCVDALDGRPGVYTARYHSDTCKNDHEQRMALLAEMKGQPNRTARFVCVLTCILPSGTMYTADGATEGVITTAERGRNGFAFDQIFESKELGKTFAEATPAEKGSVSHRGRAATQLCAFLRGIGQI